MNLAQRRDTGTRSGCPGLWPVGGAGLETEGDEQAQNEVPEIKNLTK